MAQFTYCDLFCGCGGFSIGFKEAGFIPLGGIDLDKLACESYRLNISQNVMQADITDVFGFDFLKFIGQRPDFVFASPPCEGFSDANANRIGDYWDRLYNPPGSLTIEAIDWICDLDPKIGFIIENVPAISQGPLKAYITDELQRIGYDTVYFNVIRAEKVGSGSKRPRVFISNMKFDEPWDIPIYNRFNPKKERVNADEISDANPEEQQELEPGIEDDDEDGTEHLVSALDVIADLPDPTSIHDIPDHEFAGVPEDKLKEISKLRWKNSLVKFVGSDGKMKATWIRVFPFDPAPIVMGKSTFIHPFENRQLTIREYARLQGFPDSFKFAGNYTEKRNQIGEAVSPLVSRFLARSIQDRIDGMGTRTRVLPTIISKNNNFP
nr:DNA cytosine methyltransferase [Candidatus Sigynarchaeota archaeon]